MDFETRRAPDPRYSYLSNPHDEHVQTFEPSPISAHSASFENLQANSAKTRHRGSDETLVHQSSQQGDSQPQKQEGIQDKNSRTRKLWTPLFLRRPVLIAFALVFTSLIISIAVLFHFLTQDGHILSADPKLHYLWVYGPTAVFVAISAAWVQVDYRAKQMPPWAAMAEGFQPARHSLLLDYIDPLNIVTLYKSIQNRHWTVTCAVAGTFLLQAAVVLSSGLFVSKQTTIYNTDAQVIVHDTFTGQFSGVIDQKPAANAYGILSSNLTYPQGTYERYAFQAMRPRDYAGRIVLLWGSWSGWPGSSLSGRDTAEQMVVSLPTVSPRQGDITADPGSVISSGDGNPQPTSTDNPTNTTSTTSEATSGSVSKFPKFTPGFAVACKPTYSIRKGNVTLGKSENGANTTSITFVVEEAGFTFGNISSWNMLKQFVLSISTASGITGANLDNMIDLSMSNSHANSEVEKNAGTAGFALSRLFGITTAQIANIYLKQPIQTSVLGTTTNQEKCLVISIVALCAIETFLGILTALALFLCWRSPHICASSDPSSIAGLAAVLARSDPIALKLRNTGHERFKFLERLLRNAKFKTEIAPATGNGDPATFRIATISSSESQSSPLSSSSPPTAYYQPFAVTAWGRLVVTVLLVALILTLELLYQRSAGSNGLVDIDDNNTYVQYAWTYVPTAVMVAVGLLLAALNYSIKLFSPFQDLRKGKAPADTSISENYLRSVAGTVLYRATRKREWSVVAAGLAAVLTPFLPIVASGLLKTEPALTISAGRFTRLDTIDLGLRTKGLNPNSFTNPGDAYANMVLANNLSYPRWTYQDLVFPQLASIPSLSNNTASTTDATSVTVSLPAFRARLNCTAATEEQIHCWNYKRTSLTDYAIDTYHITNDQRFLGTGVFGIVNGPRDLYDMYGTRNASCPSVLMAFGHATNHTVDGLSAFVCKPYVETISASATFRLPSWELDTTSSPPPMADESTVKVYNASHIPFFLAEVPGHNFANPLVGNIADQDLGSFFPLVVHGQDGTPIDELAGPENAGRLERAVEATYGIIMAEVMNFQRRSLDFTTADAELVVVGNLTLNTRDKVWLIQSAVSTRILEGLLGVMTVCVLVTYALLLRGSRRLLPMNPCSIAASASLLAGSEMLKRIPEGSEWLSDEERKEKGVFGGMVFTLGWWGVLDNETGQWTGERRFGADYEVEGQ
ncbi:hypothetical protein B0H63DRAFT_405165 [Podospora didyma]|uniref:Uncharacterized protein n=1 Tax=Podospora didyma TaxID=330526 RepID=A0AAE0N2H0_9PEZI|nr:hypothetical protein B0H63DRAFT_405165 [Podospora didyma]